MRINCLVDSAYWNDSHITLLPKQSHHLLRVLRVKLGQSITIFDGKGNVAHAEVDQVEKDKVILNLIKRWQEPKPTKSIILAQSLPKPDRWDLVLQKAVELGATEILPMETKHTEYHLSEKKIKRWHQIIQAAAEQSEVRWLPILHETMSYKDALLNLKRVEVPLIASLYPNAESMQSINLDKAQSVSILIGPEGDFTEKEIDEAYQSGVTPVSLGPRILRTETAAIYSLSILDHRLN